MRNKTMETTVVFVRAPAELVQRIDDFKKANGLKVRTKTVLKLIEAGLNHYEHENVLYDNGEPTDLNE